MENDHPISLREEFDRMTMFISQNPTDSFAPSPNGGSSDHRYTHHQQPPPPPLNTTATMSTSSSSSLRHVNGNNTTFLVDNNIVFPFMNNKQQQPNPVRSIHDYAADRYLSSLPPEIHDPYDYCRHPDHLYNCTAAGFHHRSSSLNGFLETPSTTDRNLDFNFSRLNISSPPVLPFLASSPGTPIRNNPIIDHSYMGRSVFPTLNRVNTGCHNNLCCNINPYSSFRRDQYGSSERGFYNVLDQNPSAIRSRDWVSSSSSSASSDLQSRQLVSKRTKFPASLKEIRGKIFAVAKDQEGCQFLQTKCEEGTVEDIEMIFNEVKDHIRELMIDASMNYLSQKLFKVCNERQMTHIVVSVISDDGNLTNICLNSHGTRAMQKLIELVTTADQRAMVVSALRRITLTLTKNTNGHHVIQHCLKSFHVDEVQPILNVVADNCLDIATDKSGCCVLQHCCLHADGVSKQRLMTEIIENALHLAEHPYGNYVVQHILGMQLPEVTKEILQKLAGNFVYLAMNKYASNVVEKCLKDVPDDQSMPIIREIANSPNFLAVIQHPFGNYVAQSALQTAKGSLKEMMINRIQKEYAFLHSHPHGKRVLALARNSRPRGLPNA